MVLDHHFHPVVPANLQFAEKVHIVSLVEDQPVIGHPIAVAANSGLFFDRREFLVAGGNQDQFMLFF
jgi:hypothetical protein